MQRWRIPLLTIAVILIGYTAVLAFSANPPNGRTGAPGEGTCADCHGNLNTGPGGITITGPPTYTPGDTIELTISVQHTGQSRWGFEITALSESGLSLGTLLVTDPVRTQHNYDIGLERQYVKQTTVGTDDGTLDVSPGWTVRWESPAVSHGSIIFYAAGNAANSNSFQVGDYIYTTSITYNAGHVSSNPSSWSAIKSLYE
jgi:hypothetical protein